MIQIGDLVTGKGTLENALNPTLPDPLLLVIDALGKGGFVAIDCHGWTWYLRADDLVRVAP